MYESKIISNEKLLKKMYGDPIAEDGTINNTYFGIEIDGNDAKKTLVGINKAIEYASKNNIENIKLEKGTYILGDEIKEAGNYILIVRDKAGNETKVRFEMQEKVSTEEYKIDGQYIVEITDNTNLEIFKNKLNGNVDYNIYRNNNLVDTESILATGDELRTVGNKAFKIIVFKIIVNGDITKDGKTDIKDLVQMRKIIISK